MSLDKNDPLVIPVFKIHTTKNEAKSREAGRPIYDDMEIVEVRFAGDRNKISIFPAHAICGEAQDEHGDTLKITYAERWSDQYKRFKAKEHQVAEGTPVDELPFLTQAKRSELKALSIYTAEALAALDGQPLKNLGQGGRDLKNQAQAYLDNASGSANVMKMAAEIEELRRTVAELRADKASPDSQFASWSADQIKDWIEEKIGERPKGNPSHATLVKRAEEVAIGLADEAA
ncbi:hypothetical protein [Bradyrhizobium sp.]|jgi:hypothetical protein|uniref:hypothetical protein n=1 Tax=Bradyrhizobium sp. TaxID=376 RepID=UPI002DDCE951|nr:hypothetical protein [Bradyrhizobium sp.]HEV2160241.1 hypothetical protein [Bradyrhizobium sp.]